MISLDLNRSIGFGFPQSELPGLDPQTAYATIGAAAVGPEPIVYPVDPGIPVAAIYPPEDFPDPTPERSS
jgi:hypothetical protein